MSGIWRLLIGACLSWLLIGCNGQPASVIVEWSTETEVNTVGFNVYRADTEAGPFTQINSQLIPPSPDPLVGGQYVYTDTQVVAGRTYYYELEDVDINGASSRHGPITVTAQAAMPRWVWGVGGALVVLAIVLIVRRKNVKRET
jgi:hypothetical protein